MNRRSYAIQWAEDNFNILPINIWREKARKLLQQECESARYAAYVTTNIERINYKKSKQKLYT